MLKFVIMETKERINWDDCTNASIIDYAKTRFHRPTDGVCKQEDYTDKIWKKLKKVLATKPFMDVK